MGNLLDELSAAVADALAHRDDVLAEADAILVEAGVSPHDVRRYMSLKHRILQLVDEG